MRNEIKISQLDIDNKYNNIDSFFRSWIDALYSNSLNDKEIIELEVSEVMLNSKNDYTSIKKSKNKTGIYIFLDQDGYPKYIGKGGTSRKKEGKDLYF